ncbi:hypothetical protein [Bacillus thuringiensis]
MKRIMVFTFLLCTVISMVGITDKQPLEVLNYKSSEPGGFIKAP